MLQPPCFPVKGRGHRWTTHSPLWSVDDQSRKESLPFPIFCPTTVITKKYFYYNTKELCHHGSWAYRCCILLSMYIYRQQKSLKKHFANFQMGIIRPSFGPLAICLTPMSQVRTTQIVFREVSVHSSRFLFFFSHKCCLANTKLASLCHKDMIDGAQLKRSSFQQLLCRGCLKAVSFLATSGRGAFLLSYLVWPVRSYMTFQTFKSSLDFVLWTIKTYIQKMCATQLPWQLLFLACSREVPLTAYTAQLCNFRSFKLIQI